MTLNPYLVFNGNCEAAFQLYTSVFDGREINLRWDFALALRNYDSVFLCHSRAGGNPYRVGHGRVPMDSRLRGNDTAVF